MRGRGRFGPAVEVERATDTPAGQTTFRDINAPMREQVAYRARAIGPTGESPARIVRVDISPRSVYLPLIRR